MKKFLLFTCFAAFLSTGLISCTDDASEITPSFEEQNLNTQMYLSDDKSKTDDIGRP